MGHDSGHEGASPLHPSVPPSPCPPPLHPLTLSCASVSSALAAARVASACTALPCSCAAARSACKGEGGAWLRVYGFSLPPEPPCRIMSPPPHPCPPPGQHPPPLHLQGVDARLQSCLGVQGSFIPPPSPSPLPLSPSPPFLPAGCRCAPAEPPGCRPKRGGRPGAVEGRGGGCTAQSRDGRTASPLLSACVTCSPLLCPLFTEPVCPPTAHPWTCLPLRLILLRPGQVQLLLQCVQVGAVCCYLALLGGQGLWVGVWVCGCVVRARIRRETEQASTQNKQTTPAPPPTASPLSPP